MRITRFSRNKLRFFALSLMIVLALSAIAYAQSVPEYKNGRYIAVSDATQHGYVMAVVTVADNRITDVRLTEIDGAGNPKPATYPWEPYHTAMEQLPQRFIEGNAADIDIVTGATSTSQKAIQAVARALLKATDPGPGRYFDGTFFGRSAADDHGYGTALVTIKDDQIVAVVLGEINADGSVKNYDEYPHETTVKGKTEMEQRIVEAGNTDVDMITGATGSSQKWISAVQNALRMAEK